MPRTKVDREQQLEWEVRDQRDRIASLEEALRNEYRASFGTGGVEAHSLLQLYRAPAEGEPIRNWADDLAEEAFKLAYLKAMIRLCFFFYGGKRALCPLCGRSPSPMSGGDYPGFAFPNGLRMHLRGQAPAKECRIMINAVRLEKARLGVREWWK